MKKAIIGLAIILAAGVLAFVILRPSASAPRLPIKKLDPWILQSNDPNDTYGTYLGNGYIAARIGPEGVGRTGPCLMSGLYEGEALKALPNWSDFPLYDEKGRRFELDKNAPYRQTLNMREGYVETELTLVAGDQRLKGKVTFLIPRHGDYDPLPDALISYRLVPRWNGTVYVKSGDFYDENTGAGVIRIDTLFSTERPGKELEQQQASIKQGKKFGITQYVVVGAMRQRTQGFSGPELYYHGDPTGGLIEDAIRAGSQEGEKYSRASWRDLWKSDIIIDGDPQAQQAVHAMMFYLLSSASPEWSIPPTGLSSGAWQGHIFWDADTWMFPALLLQYPNLAGGIVEYRTKVLGGATENARKRGLSGAEFAWESARTGLETIGQPFSEERHVTADVAIAASMAGKSPRADRLLRATAEYWASRAVYNKVKDRYEILNVVPPDEDAEIVNNSVYTNAAAKRNIELAIEAAGNAHQSYPKKWDDIVRKMYIPFDEKNRRFIEYEGYKGKKTKQADTELLIYPLAYPMPDDVKRNAFDYYKTKTDPRGPAMTSSIHSIIAAELGRRDEAYKHFVESWKPFFRGPFLMFNEKRSKTYENMCFLTGCGGSLQSVLYGFAGLRIGRHPAGFKELLPGLYIKPCLPAKWKKLEIRNLQWQGKAYNLTILPGDKWKLDKTAETKQLEEKAKHWGDNLP